MTKIIISICTYRRCLQLRDTLAAIDNLLLDQLQEEQISIAIIDNNPEGDAQEVFADYEKDGRFASLYVHEKRKGLVRARNAALKLANDQAADCLAFLDDDEMPARGWLEAMNERMAVGDVAAVSGPVLPVFAVRPEEWLPTDAYACIRETCDGYVEDAFSGNSMFLLEALQKYDITFDMRYNSTGGEDTALFLELGKKGLRTGWVEAAIVLELVPEERMQRKWLFRRWYRQGDIRQKSYSSLPFVNRLIWMGRGTIRFVAGLGRVGLAAPSALMGRSDKLTASFFTLSRGVGMIASSLGVGRYEEYSSTGLDQNKIEES